MDAAHTYVEQAPDTFRIPDEDGLEEWIEDGIRETDGRDRLWLVAESAGEVVGLLEARFEPPLPGARFQFVTGVASPRVVVENVAVLSSARRSGIGRRLIGAAEAWARERGADAVQLHTDPEGPLTGPFYRALGYGLAAGLMRKRLD